MSKHNRYLYSRTGSSYLIALLFTLFGITACSTSTTLVQSWSDPDYKGPSFNKFLVIGLFSDDSNRRFFETEFARHLNESGIPTTTSYKLIPNPEDHDEKDELEQLIRGTGVDAVLVAHFKGLETEETYVPPRTETVPMMGYRPGFYGYYSTYYATTYRPGYTRKDDIASLETRVFSTANSQLIWSGKTQSVNPKGQGKAIKEIAQKVIADMKKKGLVK